MNCDKPGHTAADCRQPKRRGSLKSLDAGNGDGEASDCEEDGDEFSLRGISTLELSAFSHLDSNSEDDASGDDDEDSEVDRSERGAA